jgi:hypothetical protein
VVVVADSNAHGCLFGSIFADRGSGFQTNVFELAVALVFVEIFRGGVIGDVNIWPAGVVEVRP